MGGQFNQLLTRRNIIQFLFVAIIMLGIPIAVNLARQQQLLRSRASTDNIYFVGSNVKLIGSREVAIDPKIRVRVVAPTNAATTAPTPTPTATSGPTPTPTAVARPNPVVSSTALDSEYLTISGDNFGTSRGTVKYSRGNPAPTIDVNVNCDNCKWEDDEIITDIRITDNDSSIPQGCRVKMCAGQNIQVCTPSGQCSPWTRMSGDPAPPATSEVPTNITASCSGGTGRFNWGVATKNGYAATNYTVRINKAPFDVWGPNDGISGDLAFQVGPGLSYSTALPNGNYGVSVQAGFITAADPSPGVTTASINGPEFTCSGGTSSNGFLSSLPKFSLVKEVFAATETICGKTGPIWDASVGGTYTVPPKDSQGRWCPDNLYVSVTESNGYILPACLAIPANSTKNADGCGYTAACVPNGSCSAATPACGQTTTGTDNCGAACTKQGAACQSTPTPGAAATPTPAGGGGGQGGGDPTVPAGVTITRYKVTDEPAGINANDSVWNSIQAEGRYSYAADADNSINFEFTPRQCPPGQPTCDPYPVEDRTVFVLFTGTGPGNTPFRTVLSANITLAMPAKITSSNCQVATSGSGTTITVKGQHLGSVVGSMLLGGQNVDLTSAVWGNEQVTVTIPTALPDQRDIVIVNNRNTTPSNSVSCAVGKSKVDIKVSLSCRTVDKPLRTAEVEIKELSSGGLATASAALAGVAPLHRNTKESFNEEGRPEAALQKDLEEGKNYSISIKAPGSIRKTIKFRAAKGTTALEAIVLPLGDIAPSTGDNLINAFDRSELLQQWSAGKDVVKAGDFNQDSRVNSMDDTCLKSNYNKSGDSL